MAKLLGIGLIYLPLPTPDVRRSSPPCPAPSPPCAADDARVDELLANASADYPLVRNMWPVPSQLISMSFFDVAIQTFFYVAVQTHTTVIRRRRQATVAPSPPSHCWPSPPSTTDDIGTDELLRQRTCLIILAKPNPRLS